MRFYQKQYLSKITSNMSNEYRRDSLCLHDLHHMREKVVHCVSYFVTHSRLPGILRGEAVLAAKVPADGNTLAQRSTVGIEHWNFAIWSV